MGVGFRLLGSVSATVDGRPADVGPSRQRVVLTALLVDVNELVSPDELTRRVWGDDPPYAARRTLYSYVSRLRRAGVPIAHRSGGYVLTAEPAEIDLCRFGELVSSARRSSDHHHAVALYEEALRLWRGEAFAGLDSPWIHGVRTGLDAERRSVELDHAELKLLLGRHTDVLAALSTRAMQHPLDERLAGQLMRALFQSGRQADALAAYRRIRGQLIAELGTEPSSELRRLHQAILSGNPLNC